MQQLGTAKSDGVSFVDLSVALLDFESTAAGSAFSATPCIDWLDGGHYDPHHV